MIVSPIKLNEEKFQGLARWKRVNNLARVRRPVRERRPYFAGFFDQARFVGTIVAHDENSYPAMALPQDLFFGTVRRNAGHLRPVAVFAKNDAFASGCPSPARHIANSGSVVE